ncbi:MAG: hypothetical protein OXT70_01265 [Chloroflexota bacterium]|nr:hypothetical protein [Chloroflexota bacterium]
MTAGLRASIAAIRSAAEGQPGQLAVEVNLRIAEDLIDGVDGVLNAAAAREVRIAVKEAMSAIDVAQDDDPLQRLKDA